MPNTERKRSDYSIEISDGQLEAFLDLAKKKDQPLSELVLAALDRYIQTELEQW